MANEKRTPDLKWLVLAALLVTLIVLLIIFFTGGGGEKIRRGPEAVSPKASPASPQQPRAVTLFFLSEDDSLLHPEEREIPASGSPEAEAERILAELILGPKSELVASLPPETKVRQVFMTKDGSAYVDFSRDIVEKSAYGSSSELGTIYSIVNTLAVNFKSVKKVYILVEGNERETLGGHLDLSRPFLPDFSLVAK